MYYSAQQIVEIAKEAEEYTHIPSGYWWAAIRSNPQDRLVDEFCCVFNLMKGEDIITTTTCTTVPGLQALKGGFRRYNNKGAGVVCANIWMYQSFKYGKHASRMRALRMVKPVWSTRDGDFDNVAEEYGKRTFKNIYANVHGATFNRWSKLVRKYIKGWSYACIVLNNNEEYNKIIDLTESAGCVSGIIIDEFSV
jgi:hypothetical protein